MKKDIIIDSLKVKQGEKVQGFVNVDKTNVKLPVTIINGSKKGKTLLLTSGVHNCEYPGIRSAIELSNELNAEDVKGQLIIIHPVNVSGFPKKVASIVPEDKKNLNRVFPPDKSGTVTDKIAYKLEESFQKIADIHIDLHGGDLYQSLTPYVYYVGVAKEEVIKQSREIAKVLNVKYMVKSAATSGFYNHSGVLGIPSILIERGGLGICKREDVTIYKSDLKNCLIKLGLIDGELKKFENKPKDVGEVIELNSKIQGCWYSNFTAGDMVKKGDLLGEIKDYFGQVLQSYYSKCNGVILFHHEAFAADIGDTLVAYAKIL